ncbi:MAG: hypothetical protein GX591_05210 [Planctomycetes bacterium]|nr:hypothetical protein [Planctomycetota bacterium]
MKRSVPRLAKAITKSSLLLAAAVLAAASGPGAAATRVVDGSHPQASDSGPGSEAQPWKTLQKAASAAMPGDVVKVLPGTYASPLWPARSGTAAAPIVFLGIPDGPARPVIPGGNPAVDLRSRAHIRIEGFEIANASGVGVNMDDGDHCQIVRCEIRNTSGNGVLVQRGTDCVVRECYIHHVGGTNIKAGGLTYRVTRCVFTRNELHDNGIEDGIQIGCGDDCEMSWNWIHDIWAPAPSHTDGIQLHSDNRNYRIVGNVVHRVRSEGFQIAAEDNTAGPDPAPLYEGNIMSDGGGVSFILSNNMRGATLLHNTIVWGRYQSVWIHNGATGATVLGNLFQSPDGGCVVAGDSMAGLTVDYNLTAGSRGIVGPHGLRGDPRLVDPKAAGSPTLPNARLRSNSPAIGAGPAGSDMGALEYPNVYVVDAHHAGATDAHYGYPGLPFRTIARAIEVAQPGETILVREGVYRETVRPVHDDVTIRAADGEAVLISGADPVTGWTRQADQWSAPLAQRPQVVLRDGERLDAFTYDAAGGRLVVQGFDPRLHPVEVVVRLDGLDLAEAPAAIVEGLQVVDTLNDWAPPKIRGRWTFYNNSAFDGWDAAAGEADDAAIAPDKTPLQSGQTAALANYTSYRRGLNGIMVDIADLPAAFDGSELGLRAGREGDPTQWPAVVPLQVAVRPGAGAGGSDRVTVVLPDGAVDDRWLQVTVPAGSRTGLEADDVFYFGNAVGETGDQPGLQAEVSSVDALRCLSHPAGLDLDDFVVLKSNFGAAVPIGQLGDYDLDRDVDLDDFTILKQAFGTVAAVDDLFDIDRDGKVNSRDANLVYERVLDGGALDLPLITAP